MNVMAVGFLVSVGLANTAYAQTAPLDENVATSYTVLGTSITWQTAGVNPPISTGTLGPFKSVCAILEGKPTTKGDVMTRSVYVLDRGNGNANTVVLHIYKRTDTITVSGGVTSDVETLQTHGKVALSLQSQTGATCYMAANDTSVFASTGANDQASLINKVTLVETVFTQQYINVGPVTQITAADEGVVFITFGTGPTAGWAEFNDASDYLATGQSYNFTVLASATNATTF